MTPHSGKGEQVAENQSVAVWDDSQITSNYANAIDVSLGDKTIDLMFGIEQARMEGKQEVRVQALKQVSLSPIAAKRLAMALKNTVERLHEPVSEPQSAAGSPAKNAASAGRVFESAEEDHHVENILTLFRALGSLNAQIDYEPSFKLVRGRVLENRFLLGINRREMDSDADARITSVCEAVKMPSALLQSFKQTLGDANHVYFGVEKDARTLIFKAYLEYRDKIEQQIDAEGVAGRAFRLFSGFKWDTSVVGRQAVAFYEWFPSIPVKDLLERLRATIEAGRHGELIGIVEGIIQQASERISEEDIQYIEVREEGNPRRSFDINLYKAGLQLEALYPHLSAALRHYNVAPERFQALFQRVRMERFGHLAGGVDRHNDDFITVYHGVSNIHSSQLRTATIAE